MTETFWPVLVGDDRYADYGIPCGAVVWLDTRVTAQAGDLVRLGTDDPPVLRWYAPADKAFVTAVARLVEVPMGARVNARVT